MRLILALCQGTTNSVASLPCTANPRDTHRPASLHLHTRHRTYRVRLGGLESAMELQSFIIHAQTNWDAAHAAGVQWPTLDSLCP